MRYALTTHTEINLFDEQDLIIRAQNGDATAFNPLVNKYQEKIYNLIYQRVRDRETAKDLCQEVFLKAWLALPNLKDRSIFYTWIYKIAVNCCIDYIRKQDRRYALGSEGLPQNPDDTLRMTEIQPSPCEILERKELRHIIRRAVQQLPPGQRVSFRLRYFHELPIKQIALRMNKSEGTIKTNLHHARHKLRNMLRPYLQNEPLAW